MASRGIQRRPSAQKLSEFSERRTTRSGKKPLPEPTHVGHFVLMVIMMICRTILFQDTSVKIGVYLIGVLLGSIICDLFMVPKSYFSDKRNFFNQYFVKLGWGWTLVLVSTQITLTSMVYCCGKWTAVRNHLMRMLVATLQWYFCVTVFRHIESNIGMCTDSNIDTKNDCLANDKGWLGFDLSGHVFLLIHNLLIISEEVKPFKDWRKLGELLKDKDLTSKRKVTTADIEETRRLYEEVTPLIKVVFIAIAVLSVLWEFMLLVTVVYRFHTLPQKIFASFVAIACWFISYRMLYRSKVPWLPCPPGKTPLEFMKLD